MPIPNPLQDHPLLKSNESTFIETTADLKDVAPSLDAILTHGVPVTSDPYGVAAPYLKVYDIKLTDIPWSAWKSKFPQADRMESLPETIELTFSKPAQSAPGEKIQQVYGVYRTIIDSENTFVDALPLILNSTMDAPKSPWDYWSTSRRFANYSKLPNPDYETRTLIDNSIASATPCWTMDENNFIASNVVAMNLVFWGTSSLPATATAPALKDPCARLPQTLRPVVLVGKSDDKSAMAASKGGYLAMYKFADGATDIATAPLRYAPNGAPTIPSPTPNGTWPKVQPYDYFSSRLRVYADRMYPDTQPLKPTATTWVPYLPYSLKAVEVSITVLTPEGSKELRGLQMINDNQKIPDADFKRIVYMHGRNYTRYIRVLSNGG